MYIFLKYFFCLHFFLTISFFSATSLATDPPLQKKTFLKERPLLKKKVFFKSPQLVTVLSFKAWVKNIKKKLKLSLVKGNQDKKKINKLLNQINQQLQAMKIDKIDKMAKGLLKTKAPDKQNYFLLPFQLASFKELFPLFFLAMKAKNKKQECVYLKQKIVYDLYPNYEDIKNIKLPYAHKELNKILQIICTL